MLPLEAPLTLLRVKIKFIITPLTTLPGEGAQRTYSISERIFEYLQFNNSVVLLVSHRMATRFDGAFEDKPKILDLLVD